MKLYINILNSAQYELNIQNNYTIDDLKKIIIKNYMIDNYININNIKDIKIFYNNKELEIDNTKLVNNNIKDNSVLDILIEKQKTKQ